MSKVVLPKWVGKLVTKHTLGHSNNKIVYGVHEVISEVNESKYSHSQWVWLDKNMELLVQAFRQGFEIEPEFETVEIDLATAMTKLSNGEEVDITFEGFSVTHTYKVMNGALKFKSHGSKDWLRSNLGVEDFFTVKTFTYKKEVN